MLYATSNGKCICAAFRLPYVTKKQPNKCEYPVSGLKRFQPEQISAVTDPSLELFGRTVGTK